MNKCVLTGNIGKDPEFKFTPSGKAVLTFSLATKEKFNDKDITDWHNIVVWGKRAETANANLVKGDTVFVIGRITNRSWDDKDGNKKYRTEIVAETLSYLKKNGDTVDNVDNQSPEEDLPF